MMKFVRYKEVEYITFDNESNNLVDENLVLGISTRKNDLFLGGNFDKELIQENRKKFSEALGMDFKSVIVPDQKHTNNIKIIKTPFDDVKETDGLITKEKNLGLMLLFADCVPVVLYAPQEKVVGVFHAGWRGTFQQISKKGAEVFQAEFGIPPEKIKAFIAPSIGMCCYEVDSEVFEKLKSTVNSSDKNTFMEKNGKYFVDLKKVNAIQLMESGIKDIVVSSYCTKCSNDIFYSYREEKDKAGRFAVLVYISGR